MSRNGIGRLDRLARPALALLLLLSAPTATMAQSQFAGVYFGTTFGSGCESGEFAFMLRGNNTAILLSFDSIDEEGFVNTSVTVNPDGTFFDSNIDGVGTSASGTFTSTGVSGTFSEPGACSGTFNGAKEPSVGPFSNSGGYYTGNISGTISGGASGTFSGPLYVVLAADGSTFAFADAFSPAFGPVPDGGTLATAPNGNVSGTLLTGTSVSGRFDTSALTGAGTSFFSDGFVNSNGNWNVSRREALPPILVSGDFDGDGKSDILWRNKNNGNTSLWQMNGFSTKSVASIGSPGEAWAIEGLADFNADSKTDVLWRHTGNGEVAIWLMNGAKRLRVGIAGSAGPAWEIVGTGDFDGDHRADILWRNTASGRALIWKMLGRVKDAQAPIGRPSLVWRVAGVGDFDADATADILWRHETNGNTQAWKMEDLAKKASAPIGKASLDWEVEGLADFNADAKADILWRNMNTGKTVAWEMNGLAQEAVRPIGTPSLVWRIDGLADTNGDRQSDIIWRHTKKRQRRRLADERLRPAGRPLDRQTGPGLGGTVILPFGASAGCW